MIPGLGDDIGSTGVFDVDSIGLVRIIAADEGADSTGTSIGRGASFTILSRSTPASQMSRRGRTSPPEKLRLVRSSYDATDLRSKVDRLPDVFGAKRLPIPVMIGILPSATGAEFLHNEVPGITLSDEAGGRCKADKDGRAEGVKMARELLMELQDHGEGVYIMPSFGRCETAAEVIST